MGIYIWLTIKYIILIFACSALIRVPQVHLSIMYFTSNKFSSEAQYDYELTNFHQTKYNGTKMQKQNIYMCFSEHN